MDFYQNLNAHFGRMAITDPFQAFQEIKTLYDLIGVSVPLVYSHIEIIMILAHAYGNVFCVATQVSAVMTLSILPPVRLIYVLFECLPRELARQCVVGVV